MKSLKVVSIKEVDKMDVYDMEVEDNHNFILSNGVIAHNSIGQGKSTVALAGVIYDMCKLLHIREPQQHYKLLKSTKIAFALMNVTLGLSRGVLYDQLITWMQNSPYFKAQLKKSSGVTLLPKNINVVMGSRFTHVLGMAIVSAVLSEINDQIRLSQAYENYTSVKSRLQSRFLNTLGYPGRMWIDSSKKDTGSFIEDIVLKGRENDPQVILHNHSIWEVQAHKGIYSGKTFKVFVGDQYKDPFVIERADQALMVDTARIIDVPIEYSQNFKSDIYGSLRDLAGIATQANYKFISSVEKIEECFVRDNPCHKVVIALDMFDREDHLINYLDFGLIKHDNRPRFIHIDLGIVRDKTGIASTRLDGVVTIERIDYTTGKKSRTSVPIYYTDFVLCIEAKISQEVPIPKIKEFIFDLNNRGYNIAMVSTDGYQSTHLRQELLMSGINADLISVDRSMDPYIEFKSAILEGRWNGVRHEILQSEIKKLEKTSTKVDHNIDSSKDLADAVCGSIWSAKINMARYSANITVDDYIKAIDKTVLSDNVYDQLLRSGGKIIT